MHVGVSYTTLIVRLLLIHLRVMDHTVYKDDIRGETALTENEFLSRFHSLYVYKQLLSGYSFSGLLTTLDLIGVGIHKRFKLSPDGIQLRHKVCGFYCRIT